MKTSPKQPPRPCLRRALCVLLAVTGIPSAARADDAEDLAEIRFREGVSSFSTHDYEAATRKFREAWILSKQERFLWNVGLSELNAGRFTEAYRDFLACSKERGISKEHWNQVADAKAYAADHILLLNIAAPPGAAVTIDGELAGVAPLPDPLPADRAKPHALEAIRGGSHTTYPVPPTDKGILDVTLSFPAVEVAPRALEVHRAEKPRSDAVRLAASGTLATAGVAAGVVTIVMALNLHADQDQASALTAKAEGEQPTEPPGSECRAISSATCSQLASVNASKIRDQNLELGFGIATGALLATGIGTYFLWPHIQKWPSHISFVPAASHATIGGSIAVTY